MWLCKTLSPYCVSIEMITTIYQSSFNILQIKLVPFYKKIFFDVLLLLLLALSNF